ncbi:MAG: hypothetical protein KDI71_13605 [Xanthomonadales bacterium]|nr:hypothetical protein [Xanthomonadales bacterium]
MRIFQAIAAILLLSLLGYTVLTVANEGLNFLPAAAESLAAMGWSGQFAADFSCYLVVSALWVLWRHRGSGAGWLFAVGALIGGFLYFGAYLLIASVQARGSISALLLGQQSASSEVNR